MSRKTVNRWTQNADIQQRNIEIRNEYRRLQLVGFSLKKACKELACVYGLKKTTIREILYRKK